MLPKNAVEISWLYRFAKNLHLILVYFKTKLEMNIMHELVVPY